MLSISAEEPSMHLLRKIQAVGLLIVVAIFVAACGPASESEPEPALAPATIRWQTWDLTSQAEELLVRQFQEHNPQIQFERGSQDGSPEQELNETPPPDLLNMDAGRGLIELARAGLVADLTELWQENGLIEAVPPQLQALTAYQDRQYYMPTGFGWKAIYYNKAIFDQYGLTPPQTWEEFLAICETLLTNGETPLSISGSEAWAIFGWFEYLNLRINGPEFHRNLLAGHERYDDPRVRRVMETWQSLFTNGYFIEQPNTIGSLTSMTAIIRGDNGMLGRQRAVMVLADTYTYGELPAPFQAEVDFFRFPVIDPALPVAEVVDLFGYIVPLGADQLPATLHFLEYAGSAETQGIMAQAAFFQSAQFAPARGDVAEERLSANQRKALALVNEADEAVLSFVLATPREMFGQVYYRFTSFVNEPTEIDEFLLKFEEVRQNMVAQGKLQVE
jgi:ABC-type glycerol-3-phosphate transport system substrate-binding protein